MVERQVYHSSVTLVLASASPRRAELLHAAGYDFLIDPADADEVVHPGECPTDYALRVAEEKSRIVAARHPGACVLGADTIVVVDSAILGKPRDAAEAGSMLRRLSGRRHEVFTGVHIACCSGTRSFVVRTLVDVQPLTDADIRQYVESGEPMGKAGAYAIQGRAARYIPRIEGSYSNVVGLPVAEVASAIRELAVEADAPRMPRD